MTFGDLVLRLLFLVQTGIGVLGNTLLLSACASTSCTGHPFRPIHLIVTNMAVANFLVLLFKGIPQMIFIWGVTHILDNGGCKLVYYIHRMARGLSMCTTCLLSNFQAITISSRTAGWMALKARAWKNISSSCFLCWISNLLINIFVPIYLEARQHTHNSTKKRDYGLCFSANPETSIDAAKYVLLLTLPDLVFMGLMITASVYIVIFLYRHQQRVRHIYTPRNAHQFSPESKATQTVMLLASTFILFYFTNSILILYDVFFKSHIWLQYTTTFLTACYPTLSPLILLLQDSQAPRFCS